MLLGESHIHTDNEIDLVRRSVLNGKAEETSPLDLLRIIETSGRGLLTVINHLIDLDAQSTKVNRELCDLHDIEEEVLDSIVQHSSKEKMKDLLLVSDSHLDGATGDCVVSDRLLLRQTIAALVQNAVEATSGAGMVMVKVSLSGEPGVDQTLDVEVRDTGVGIADVRSP
jgi:signal transduction histidine kinase